MPPGFTNVLVLVAIAAVAVGGLLLQLAVRWTAKFTPAYWLCIGVVLVAGTTAAITRFTLRATIFVDSLLVVVACWVAVATVAITAVAVRLVLRRPDGQALRWSQALAATGMYTGLGLVLGPVFALMAFAAFVVFAPGDLR